MPIPPPIEGIALIDTGAALTAVDASIFRQLGTNPVGEANIATAAGLARQFIYPVRFVFPGTPLPSFEIPQSIGCDLTGQAINGKPIVALIGRDMLTHAVFVYNGTAGTFSLSF